MYGSLRSVGVALLATLCLSFAAALAPKAKPSDFPDCAQAWAGAEAARAAELLGSDKVRLPLLSDDDGAVILGRLLSRDNLAFYADQATSIERRISDYLETLNSYKSILVSYLLANQSNQNRYHSEIAALMAYMLHEAVTGTNLMNEFLPTVPRDKSYETRMQGVQSINNGFHKMFEGALMSTYETTVYSRSDISALLAAMAETLPVLKPGLPETTVNRLRSDLIRRQDSLQTEPDREAVKRMLAALDA